MHNSDLAHIKKRILESAFVNVEQGGADALMPDGSQVAWYFDFRCLFLEKDFLHVVARCFWHTYGANRRICIGGIESAAIPLITGLVANGNDSSGFYIRKSRKKKTTMKQIEGRISNADIVLVDDLINTGSSFEKQLEILKSEGHAVTDIFVLIRLRDEKYYTNLTKHGVRIHSLFTSADFGLPMIEEKPPQTLEMKWSFAAKDPHFFEVTTKSIPVVEKERLYIATDNGYVWCLDKHSGKILWKSLVVLRKKKNQHTFTQITISEDKIIVGAANGSVYFLHITSGRILRVISLSERIYTKVIPMQRRGLYVCGVSHKKAPYKNYLTAFTDCEKIWEVEIVGIPSSPLMHNGHNILITATNSGDVYAHDQSTGRLRWSYKTHSPIHNTGTPFHKGEYVAFSSYDGSVHILTTRTGMLHKKIRVADWLYASPLIDTGRIYTTSLDRSVYCHNLNTGDKIWEHETRGRIFSAPVINAGYLYVGNNEGRLLVLDKNTGKECHHIYMSERITNPVVINEKNILVSTFADEIYCLYMPSNIGRPQ